MQLSNNPSAGRSLPAKAGSHTNPEYDHESGLYAWASEEML
jgi:hypothetical protein